MNKNTKNILWLLGIGAVAYYFLVWEKSAKDKANDEAKNATKGSASNFTGDLSVPQYQNAMGTGQSHRTAVNKLGRKKR